MGTATILQHKPAPASAEVRATKLDRQKFLEAWAHENPLGTIEQAREALRQKFNGVAMGTKVLSDTLRNAKHLWDSQRRSLPEPARQPDPMAAFAPTTPGLPSQVAFCVQAMKMSGIRLLEVFEDGRVRVEYRA